VFLSRVHRDAVQDVYQKHIFQFAMDFKGGSVDCSRSFTKSRAVREAWGDRPVRKEAAKRRTKANRTVGPTLKKGVGGPAGP